MCTKILIGTYHTNVGELLKAASDIRSILFLGNFKRNRHYIRKHIAKITFAIIFFFLKPESNGIKIPLTETKTTQIFNANDIKYFLLRKKKKKKKP